MVGDGSGHIQSLILSAVLMLIGFFTVMIGLLADLIRGNRRLIEDTQYRVKKMEIARLEHPLTHNGHFNGLEN